MVLPESFSQLGLCRIPITQVKAHVALLRFYRAMHYSAKRGLAIARRPSVSLSVSQSACDVGG